MENFGLKGLAITVWQRVFLSYSTTFYGLALVMADAAVSYASRAPLPSWAHYAVGTVATVLAMVKERSSAEGALATLPPARGGVRLGVLATLSGGALVTLGALGALAGCATVRGAVPVVSAEVAACGQGAVELAQAVDGCLSGAGWLTCLDSLATTASAEVRCVVETYAAATEPPLGPPLVARTPEALVATPASCDVRQARATEWIALHR